MPIPGSGLREPHLSCVSYSEIRIMARSRIFVFVLTVGLIGISYGAEETQAPRSPRTIARFFGIESPREQPQPQPQPQAAPQQQQQQVPAQTRKPVPLIYSVKYYDRTGEGEKSDVVPDHGVVQDGVQGVPARVFLNLYSGQQTPVYYDNKGQVLVPCPVYDHLYVAGVDQSLVRKPPPSKVVQTAVVPVPPPVAVPQIQPVPEFVYYASPSYVGHNPGYVGHTHNPVHKPNPAHGGLTLVGAPFDYPYPQYQYPGIYPYSSPSFNPYVFIKPTPPGHSHHHGSPSPTVQQVQQAVTQVVDKKEGDKLD